MNTETSSNDLLGHLLRVTETLIYNGGICATGMDLIVKTSGVSRKTIYKYFANKDDLIAEALRRRDQRWMEWFIQDTEKHKPGKRLLGMFDVLHHWINTPEFRGCAFINAAGEIGDPNDPIRLVAKEHKENLFEFIRILVKEHCNRDNESLATQFLLLIDGAITMALVMGNLDAAQQAKNVAKKLISL